LTAVRYDENGKIFGWTKEDGAAETGRSSVLSDQAIMTRGLRPYRPSERLLELPIVDWQPGLLR
jgi:hypothetical protein